MLDGYLLVYLNVDQVMSPLSCHEDEPEPRADVLLQVSDTQAELILNMRLRSLRRLEEMEIHKEHKSLSKERKDIQARRRRTRSCGGRASSRNSSRRENKIGSGALGPRRTELGDAAAVDVATHAFVETRAGPTRSCRRRGGSAR